MENVLLTVHLIACIAMTGVIMLQRSEGGVQGMSGGGTGGLISGRGAASVLVRTTMICAGIFFVTSLVMVRLNGQNAVNPYAAPQNQPAGIDIPAVAATPDPFAAGTPGAPALPGPTTAAPADPFAAPATPGASPSAAAPTAAPTTAAPAAPRPTPSATASAPATTTPAPTPQ